MTAFGIGALDEMADSCDSMIPLSHISNSQEQHLRTCGFAGDQDPSPEDDSTTSQDHFQTPPEVGLGESVMEDAGVLCGSDVVPHQLDGNVVVDPASELPRVDETPQNGIGASNANHNQTTTTEMAQSPMLLPPHLMDLVYMMSGFGQMDRRKEDDDAEDILEVARRAGMKIPRPRWWGDDPWWRKDSGN